MKLLRWTIGKKMFLMGLGIVLALAALAGMFYYTTDLIRQGTHASALRNQQLDLVNRLNGSVLTLILAAMDSIIDKDQGALSEERIRIITEQTAYVQANLDHLAGFADTAEEVRLVDEIRATFPKLQTDIQTELVRLIEESVGQLRQIDQDFMAIDDTLDLYGDQIEADLRLLKASVQQEQIDATNLALLRNQQVAILDKFLRAHATLMLAAMNAIIDRDSGIIAAEHRQTIQDKIAFMQANLKPLEELADTDAEAAAAETIRDTFPKLADGIQEDLVRLIEASARQGQPLEQDFIRIDATLDAYGEKIEESLSVIFASVQQEQVDASQLALLRNQQMQVLNTLSEAHANVMLAAMDSIIDKDEGAIQADRMAILETKLAVMRDSLETLDELADTDAERAAAARIRETVPKLAEGIQGTLATLIAESVVMAQQIEADFARLDDELDLYGDAIQAALGQIILSVQSEQQEAEAALLATIEDIARTGVVILGAALVILILAFTLFSRSISKPIVHGADVAAHLADGDLSVNVRVRGRDETGQLLRAMDHMVARLQEMVVMVKGGAMNVASGSQEMAQGASEQAAAAEEASSSMEEMVANIRQNSDNALQTEKIALEAATNAREGGQAVTETVRAMKEIAQKITIIEEIARQTHMLSLNATIEAAKAQDYGRGFAVVAAEVRALAERSRTAANEINTLAGSSVATAVRAGELLAKVVPDIQKTAELVQEISAASREQNSGAEQINRAIQQLDQVIQQNASVSEELASQAEQLQSSIEFFKTAERRDRQILRADKTLGEIAHLASSTPPRPADSTPPQTVPGYAMKLKPGEIAGDDKDRDFERY